MKISARNRLKGKIVGVQISTAHARFMEKYFGSAVTIKTYDTQDNVNADLVAGRIDLEMADAVNLADFLKTDEGKDFAQKKARELRERADDLIERGKDTASRHKESISAAVEGARDAYRREASKS